MRNAEAGWRGTASSVAHLDCPPGLARKRNRRAWLGPGSFNDLLATTNPNVGEAVVQLILNPLVAPSRAQRILVIRLAAMGDVVRTLPSVALLRDQAPEARIDWLVEERTASVIEARGFIDGVVVFPRAQIEAWCRAGRWVAAARAFAGFVRGLRAGNYDLVLDFHAIARSGLLSALSGAPRRISYARPYAREGAQVFATHRVRLSQPRVSRFARNEALVRAIVGADAVPKTAPLEVAAAAREAMAAALGRGRAPVVLHPGSSVGASHKRWPVAHFGALARALVRDGERVLVVVGSDAAEQAAAEAVVAASGGTATLAPPTPEFEDLAALLEASRALVAADSGPLHTASLVGTPVVQLLGPTDEVENEPWSATPSRRVVTDLECRGCGRGCAAAACMRGIDAGAVRSALRSLIGPPVASLRVVSPSVAP